MRTLIQDLHYGIRQLRRNPGFAGIAILTIALGIGVTTAMFSVVNSVLLRPLPFRQPDRLLALGGYDTRAEVPQNGPDSISYPELLDIRERNRSLVDLSVYEWREETLTGAGEPRHVNLAHVSASLFPLLGVNPYLGRVFSPEEDQPGHYSVILSYRLWRTSFNGSNNVIGRNINLNGHAYTVVGVMPQGFQFPIAADARDVWVTLAEMEEVSSPGDVPLIAQRGFHVFGAVARLRDGVALTQANADLKSIAQALTRQYPNESSHRGLYAMPELESLIGDVRTPLVVLLAAVCLVLLIACANVANLLLVRGSDRSREIGVRAALGATRFRLVRQLIVESVALSVAGSALGVLFASWMLSGVLRLYPENLPRADQIGIDLRVVLFSAGLAILTGVLFGLVPSLHSASPVLAAIIRSGSRTSTASRGHNRLRSGLVIAETALGVTLLIAAGLLLRSLYRLSHVDLGFDPNHLLTASFDLPDVKYNPDQQDSFIRDLQARINALPGVVKASGVIPLPMGADRFNISFNLVDHPVPEANEPSAEFHVVTNGFFETMRMPLVRGRFFNEHDQRNAEPVMIVNAAFARKYFPNEDPVGRLITIGAGEGPARAKYKTRQVVGIVGNLRSSNLAKDPDPAYFVPLSQLMFGAPTLVVRTAGDPKALASEITTLLRSMDPESPLYSVRTMQDCLALDLGRARFQTVLLGLFAGIALLLTAVGLYGVMAQSVAQRTQEIGIRMALGATREDVRAMVLRRGTVLSLAGTVIGIIAALGLARVIESLLYEIPPRDPMTYVGVCVVLILVSLASSYVPAARATKLDPMVALRYE
ncbi:MAG TPA: ABC transporter permease [Candidatus Sulfotelmatobacter sp.]|nr:ABC transporter permease [Candidatus Sulfotelmatobacter sp.]